MDGDRRLEWWRDTQYRIVRWRLSCGDPPIVGTGWAAADLRRMPEGGSLLIALAR